MNTRALPFGSYVYHGRIKYDHGYQDADSPFAWEEAGIQTFEKHSQGEGILGEVANLFPGFDIPGLRRCVYCGAALRHSKEFEDGGPEWSRGDAVTCDACGWWLYAYTRNKCYPWESLRNELFEGAVYAFDVGQAAEPITKLRAEIRRQQKDLRSVSPRELEILVGSVLRDFLGCGVHHVGGPGDNGIDLLLSDGERPLAVQVKRREQGKPSEGVRTIRDFLGALILAGLPKGIVVSTADDFSAPARKAVEAEMLTRVPIQVELYNYHKLRDMLSITALPDKPWLTCVPEARLGRKNWKNWPPRSSGNRA